MSIGTRKINRWQDVLRPLRNHDGVAMTLRLPERDDAALTALAKADGVSKHEATVRAIREVVERRGHEERVAAASQRVRTRYADVIERLSK